MTGLLGRVDVSNLFRMLPALAILVWSCAGCGSTPVVSPSPVITEAAPPPAVAAATNEPAPASSESLPLQASITLSGAQPCEATGGAGTTPIKCVFSVAATGGVAPYTYEWLFRNPANGREIRTNAQSVSPIFSCEFSSEVSAFALEVSVRVNGSAVLDSTTINVTRPNGDYCSGPPIQASITVSGQPCVSGATTPITCVFSAAATGGVSPYFYRWVFRNPLNGFEVGHVGQSVRPTLFCDFSREVSTFPVEASLSVDGSPTLNSVTINATRPTGDICAGPPIQASIAVSGQPCVAGNLKPITCVFSVAATGGVTPYIYAWRFKNPSNGREVLVGNTQSASPSFECGFSGGASTFAVEASVSVNGSPGVNSVTINATRPANDYCVGPPIQASITVSGQPCVAGTSTPITCVFSAVATGGIPPYTYQWFFQSPQGAQLLASGQSVSPVLSCNVWRLRGTFPIDALIMVNNSPVLHSVFNINVTRPPGDDCPP